MGRRTAGGVSNSFQVLSPTKADDGPPEWPAKDVSDQKQQPKEVAAAEKPPLDPADGAADGGSGEVDGKKAAGKQPAAAGAGADDVATSSAMDDSQQQVLAMLAKLSKKFDDGFATLSERVLNLEAYNGSRAASDAGGDADGEDDAGEPGGDPPKKGASDSKKSNISKPPEPEPEPDDPFVEQFVEDDDQDTGYESETIYCPIFRSNPHVLAKGQGGPRLCMARGDDLKPKKHDLYGHKAYDALVRKSTQDNGGNVGKSWRHLETQAVYQKACVDRLGGLLDDFESGEPLDTNDVWRKISEVYNTLNETYALANEELFMVKNQAKCM